MENDMYIIAGLGNPGRQYAHTRHNVGYDVIDVLADRYRIEVDSLRFQALVGKGMAEGHKVILAKPVTFMNLSGQSVRELVHFYKINEKARLIVVYDDISLPPGQLRIREKGSAGGHNGIKNIIAHLGGQEFLRVKVGIGEKPPGYDLADYVLSHFSTEERKQLDAALVRAADAVAKIIADGADAAMNEYNRKVTV